MKKFWKNICIGAMAVTSIACFSGCGKDKTPSSVDLDNDGVVSEWETLFERSPQSDRLTIANVIEINNLSELKAINDSKETKVYKLVSDIDCGGETLSINLGKSSLYGNNKVIKNFKLADCSLFEEGEDVENVKAKGLFYNGVAIYDLRLFMGNQTFSFSSANELYTISPFINVPVLDNITVKGKIDVNRKHSNVDIKLSLLASSLEEKKTDLSITNCNVIGNINYVESEAFSTVYAGAIASKLSEDDLVYNCTVNSNINVVGSDMNVGLITGFNEGFVSTVNTTGSINTSYYSLGNSNVGGIVGVNSRNAEVKNATTNAIINFSQDINLSGAKEFATGGIAGLNNGVISFSTSDATLNINSCEAFVYMGSIAGKGNNAIYYNIIARGNLNPKNCSDICIADVVGYSKFGYFEKIITNANINIDNASIDSVINVGLVTIFENLDDLDNDVKYNAEFTPNFKNILIGGSCKVYTNASIVESSRAFRYNLGLRNEYEYFVENEEFPELPDLEPGENDDPESEENPEDDIETKTLVPNIYSSLHILDTYVFQKYKVANGETSLDPALKLTYAKDSSGNKYVTTRTSNIAMQLKFFVVNLGFNYYVGNNEIDLSSFEIPKMKFTLSKESSLERFFRYDKKEYNGILSTFDKEFENPCTYDIGDEMFSYLNKIITKELTSTEKSYSVYSPLLISKEFATSLNLGDNNDELEGEDSSNAPIIEDSMAVYDRFADNICRLLELMKVSTSPTFMTYRKEVIDLENQNPSDSSSEDPVVKYIQLKFNDSKFVYSIEFDVTEMVNDPEKSSDNYIVYMKFNKDKK